MDNTQQQVVEALKSTSNILVTVRTDPSVDGLSAALGLTLLLDKLGKRATAIFSGAIPRAINFLEPDKTFEDTADSLRDFIIALDKEKADHLRYKVDGDVVKIFITPYKTMLSQSDLEFSQGDYNVELVVALGVTSQDNLDKALDAHGKILHDAKVITITAGELPSNLGGIDWHDKDAGSLSEMIVTLSAQMSNGEKLLDEQIATALLTGIVSATDRFSNDRTTSRVMTMAAQLMAAGANQQLIAAKLEEGHDIAPGPLASAQSKDSSGSSNKDGNELVIDRGVNLSKSQNESIAMPSENNSGDVERLAQPSDNSEEQQTELEKQLANLIKPGSSATLADIEKELGQGTANEQVPTAESPAVSSEVSMPSPEATESPLPTISPETVEKQSVPVEPVLVPEPAAEPSPPAIEILTEQSPSEMVASEPPSPINSTLSPNNPEEMIIDPFNMPQTAHEGISVTPIDRTGMGGTPEGAALLATPPESMSENSVPPAISLPDPAPDQTMPAPAEAKSPEPEVPELPPLPPLPPLPSDGSVPPLPPPPPSPMTFGGQGSVMQSGAVSGDIFGDSDTPSTPPTEPSSNEPGVFKIPGQ